MSPADETKYLAFGIPSLDRLLGFITPSSGEGDPTEAHLGANRPYLGYCLNRPRPPLSTPPEPEDETTTFCVIGPDGTGKSLFAMHMVSDYWRRTRPAGGTRVIYASTDLSYHRADTVWRTFWLHRPISRSRRLPFEEGWRRAGAQPDDANEPDYNKPEEQLNLKQYRPIEQATEFATSLAAPDARQVTFLDLEATTSGDDWGLLHTLLAVLEEPAPGEPRHLLVIDAVEGLETLVGERDEFGERQSRRARIAQLIRAAARKCHLVFVVEEPKDGERLPEVFVADVVIRLRSEMDRDYARRTVEVEKVRGQPHVRGPHDFRIRQRGSKTGAHPNPDDPEVGWFPSGRTPGEMAYVQVFPSLHQLSRELCGKPAGRDPGAHPDPTDLTWRYASFGIIPFDEMLAQARYPLGDHERATGAAGADRMGLPLGTVTTLIGNESTYKSQLARAFLSQAFRSRHEAKGREPKFGPLYQANQNDPLSGQGVAVLLATYDTDRETLAKKLRHHLIRALEPIRPGQPTQDQALAPPVRSDEADDRVLVRRLETHHLPSAALMHVIQRLIEEAEHRLHAPLEKDWEKRREADPKLPPITDDQRREWNGRIRFVIDDWSTILATYPEVARDPLFPPYLMYFLRRKGVTTLILATQAGNPADRETGEVGREVRELKLLADHRLLTWHFPFYGERRVAISALPSMVPGLGQSVRELRPGRMAELHHNRLSITKDDTTPPENEREKHDKADNLYDQEALVVDPHFELYAGLDVGRPVPVPLQVRLYAEKEETPAFRGYLTEVEHLFRQMFGEDQRTVLRSEYGPQYDILRELSYLQSEARLDHTLVLQVDEFWAESRSELRRQERYLNARTVDRSGKSIRGEDPFGLFRLTDAIDHRREASDGVPQPIYRHQYFDLIGYDFGECAKQFPIYKVPYSWDFGFLICDQRAWEQAFQERDHRTARVVWGKEYPWGKITDQAVQDIWHRLWKISLGVGSHADFRRLAAESDNRDINFDRPFPQPSAHWTQTKIKRRPGGEEVLDISHRRGNPPKEGKTDYRYQPEPVSWREFFGACKTIARFTRYGCRPFDIDLTAVESFSCLVFEVWMSEVYQACETARVRSGPVKQRAKKRLGELEGEIKVVKGLVDDDKVPEGDRAKARRDLKRKSREQKLQGQAPERVAENDSLADELRAGQNSRGDSDWRPRARRDQPHGASLSQLLGKPAPGQKDGERADRLRQVYRQALYRTFLLLDEVVPEEQLAFNAQLNLTPRPAATRVAAARHWYSTATVSLTASASDRSGRVVVGLPGHFAVRGDWFLAVARGSRSPRLGERAMDVLCSRRGNITRLQCGLGLPVRDLFGTKNRPAHREHRLEYRTALPYVPPDGEETFTVAYEELRKLGALDQPPRSRPRGGAQDDLGRKDNFFWFWRSTIKQYDLHARIWQKWLFLVMREWRRWGRGTAPRGNRLNARPDEPWWDGFKEYDHHRLEEMNNPGASLCHVDEQATGRRWEQFDESCDGLIEALERASRHDVEHRSQAGGAD